MRLVLTALVAVFFTGLCQATDYPGDADVALVVAKTKHRMLSHRTTATAAASCDCPKGACPAGGNCTDCKCSPKAVATTGDKPKAKEQTAGSAPAPTTGVVTSGSCSNGSCSTSGTTTGTRSRGIFSASRRGSSRCSGG
jgi:hypothetical protein